MSLVHHGSCHRFGAEAVPIRTQSQSQSQSHRAPSHSLPPSILTGVFLHLSLVESLTPVIQSIPVLAFFCHYPPRILISFELVRLCFLFILNPTSSCPSLFPFLFQADRQKTDEKPVPSSRSSYHTSLFLHSCTSPLHHYTNLRTLPVVYLTRSSN